MMRINEEIKFIKYFHFYSVWSCLIHGMYFLNIIGNTFPIALFVLIISQIFLFVYPAYITYTSINWFYEFTLHWLPVFIITPSLNNTNYLYISLILYALIFNTNIFNIYKDPVKYLNE